MIKDKINDVIQKLQAAFPDSTPTIGNEYGLPAPDDEIIIDVLNVKNSELKKFGKIEELLCSELFNQGIFNINIFPVSPKDTSAHYAEILEKQSWATAQYLYQHTTVFLPGSSKIKVQWYIADNLIGHHTQEQAPSVFANYTIKSYVISNNLLKGQDLDVNYQLNTKDQKRLLKANEISEAA